MTYLANSLTSQPWTKSGVLTVILYQLDILIVKVGQADNEMYNVPGGYTGRVFTGMGLGPYLGTHAKPITREYP